MYPESVAFPDNQRCVVKIDRNYFNVISIFEYHEMFFFKFSSWFHHDIKIFNDHTGYHKDAKSWSHGFSVPAILDTIDYMIALPIVKTHWTALFTMGLKSQISITSDIDRRQLPHGQNEDELFGNMVAEANLVYKPDFYISDATKCFVTESL